MEQSTPVSLLLRVRDSKDNDSWDEFYRFYEPFLIGMAHRLGLKNHDASEVVQDVFVTILEHIKTFEYDPRKGRFRGWLKTVTTNAFRDRYRRTQRRKEVGLGANQDDPPFYDELEESWDPEYRQRVLDHAMDVVRQEETATNWACFQEHTLKKRRAADVGKELGLSTNAIYVYAHRVFKKIQAKCLELDEDLTDA